jgi:hypothetical protein
MHTLLSELLQVRWGRNDNEHKFTTLIDSILEVPSDSLASNTSVGNNNHVIVFFIFCHSFCIFGSFCCWGANRRMALNWTAEVHWILSWDIEKPCRDLQFCLKILQNCLEIIQYCIKIRDTVSRFCNTVLRLHMMVSRWFNNVSRIYNNFYLILKYFLTIMQYCLLKLYNAVMIFSILSWDYANKVLRFSNILY